MPISLPPDVELKLQAQVDRGRFDSVEAALRAAVERLDREGPAEDASSADALLLHAIAESKAGQFFDGQPVGETPAPRGKPQKKPKGESAGKGGEDKSGDGDDAE